MHKIVVAQSAVTAYGETHKQKKSSVHFLEDKKCAKKIRPIFPAVFV